MRKFAFGAGITAAVVILVAVYARLPVAADAFPHAQTSTAIDAYAIQATIDVNALPRHETLSEADE
jgi:hypothetical protein